MAEWTKEEKLKFWHVVLTEADRGLRRIEIAGWAVVIIQVVMAIGCFLHVFGVVDWFGDVR